MIMLNKLLTAPVSAMVLGLSVAALTTPSFAQAQRSEFRSNAARDAAIHDCSVKASKHSNGAEQTMQFAAYSNCMVEHGQQP
jgi:hypothetical protein